MRHIRVAAAHAVEFSRDRKRDDLDNDVMLRFALTELVEIIGEAAEHVGPAARAQFPDVPRSDAARTRDRLVRHYCDIDLDVLLTTVNVDLPALLSALEPPGSGPSAPG
ncbi:MAG: HepT-like ribonuclease domain-containing protein [Pseudonocardia sp.]